MKPDIQRIESLIAKAETLPDAEARTCAIDLLQSLMELHGSTIARLMQIVSDHGVAGQEIQKAFVKDDAIGALLLLYGLHPLALNDRIKNAVEKLRANLNDGQVELISIEEGIVRLRATVDSHSCHSSNTRALIESAIIEAAPDISELIIDEVTAEPQRVLVQLQGLSVSKAAPIS